VSNTYTTNQYAEIGLASGDKPLITPTDVAPVGTQEYTDVVADNAARGVVLDDGASINFLGGSTNKAIPLPYLTDVDVTVGAAVSFTQPVILDYRNNAWKVQPTAQVKAGDPLPVTIGSARAASAPNAVGGDISIASFNVLNYFTTTAADVGCTSVYTDRDGNPITANQCPDNGPRGAATDVSLKRQQDKIVKAINALGTEVVSLEEIENSAAFGENRDSALSTLVDALNADLGADEWAYVPSPTQVPAGEDVIRTAFIYKADVVSPVGDSVIDLDDAFVNARRPLAQAFAPKGETDAAFLAIVNHFKSKGDNRDNPATGDNANGPQGAYNGDRVRQAQALVDFAAEQKTAAGTDRVFLLGDFNSYTQEDPMQVLYAAGYTDLGSRTGKHTYSFEGASGSLDHVLASQAALPAVTGVDVWNINAGESIALEYSRYNYNATNFYEVSPYRSSDHDPVVVGVAWQPTVPINLLNINDFHGRIDANTVKFAGTVEQLRAEYGDENTLFLSSGDNIGASLFASSFEDDQPTIDVLNALGLKAAAVGNHEFDKGFADLKDRVQPAADFTYLGANVYKKGTTTPALPEYATFEVDGLTVAVIGAVTEETPTLVTPAGIADVEFGDPVDAVNRVAAKLEAEGDVDVIVAEYHEGAAAGDAEKANLADEIADGKAFADIVQNTSASVDAIFTGHTHKKYAWDAPIPGEPGATRPVVQTGSYGENIGHVVLNVDPQTGDVLSYEKENVARTKTDDAELVAAYPRVAEVKQIVDGALARAQVVGDQPIGSVSADITTAFEGGSFVDGAYAGGTRDNRAAQSTLGNLVADSLVATLSDPLRGGAEIGVVNPGGLRAELLRGDDGVITFAEANAVLPFVNNLWTTTLTGAQFTQVLEEQWQTNADGSIPSRPYLALGLSKNVTYTYDADAPQGSHITGVWIDGKPIDPNGSYRIGSFNFLLTGGDNFRTFTQGTDTRDSGLIDRDAWISYLTANSPVSPSYATRSAEVTGLPASAAAGAQVSFQVGGLNLTSLGSPETTSLLVSIEGSNSVIDPITVANGSATVAFTVPADAPAQSTIVLQAPQTGTELRLPLTVTGGSTGGGTDTPPTTTPQPVDPSQLIPALQDLIKVIAGELRAGATITIHVGTQYAGDWVTVWLYSTPRQLGGWHLVDAAGNVTVTLPTDLTGDHRLVVLDASGQVIGWQAVSIAPRSGALAATGAETQWIAGVLLAASLLLALGIVGRAVPARRRS
jgi:5'-nucleotidase